MARKPKKMKLVFAPGAFDNFDGTQEELDELVAEIKNMFENATPEEIQARSRPVEDGDLPDEVLEQLSAYHDNKPRKDRLQ